MKKIVSMVLAVVMLMVMAIPAFAATGDEVVPYASCNGNHTYDVVVTQVTYANALDGCEKTVVKNYKCRYCTSAYTAKPITTIVSHVYKVISASCNTVTQTHNYKCSNCKDLETVYKACPGAGHNAGNCSWLPI